MTATSPLVRGLETLALTVQVGGTAIPDTYQVAAIEVDRAINRIPTARITIADGDISEGKYEGSDSSIFIPGASVEISAGYSGATSSIFSGVIVRHAVRMRPDGSTLLVLTCADKATKLAMTRMSQQYVQQKDSDIMSSLIADAGLTPDVQGTTVTYAQAVQHYASAWDFIVSRADANGFLVIVDDGTVQVKAPAFSAPSVVVRLGESLAEFEAEIDARTQLPTITSSTWDYTTQEVVSATSSEPSVNSQGNLSGTSLLSTFGLSAYQLQAMAPVPQEALKAWADSRLQRSRLARIRGHATFPGNATVVPGGTLELASIGARFNGDAYVTEVEHRLEPGQWSTRVTFGLSPEPFTQATDDIPYPGAAGLYPPIHGLHIAQVLGVSDDPDGQRRVKVAMPLVAQSANGLWVRMLAPYATNNAGIDFMPEVNDEVVLGFLGGDPNAAIMLGALHSSKIPAPYVPTETNDIKAIVTKSQLKITFDDAKKILTLVTPGGHTLVLSDDAQQIDIKDSNGNECSMTSSGVALSSPADISLKAQGSVTIEGASGVSISSPMDVKADGANVQLSAKMSFQAQGQASAQLSASGQVSVNGALVMIN